MILPAFVPLVAILATFTDAKKGVPSGHPIDPEVHALRLAFAKDVVAPASPITLPTNVAFQSVVKPLISKVDVDQITTYLTRLTQFPERHYKSQNGVDAANWILNSVQSLSAPSGTKITASLFKHSKWIQPSVIARYESTNATSVDGIIVTGTHFDTAAYDHPDGPGGANPAADDCASGSTVIYETLRVLTKSGFVPNRPIEFHWYAAEEFGLLGSYEIAHDYARRGVSVVSYLNLDQSGYIAPGSKPVIGIMADYVTPEATKFLTSVATAYSGLPVVGGQKCGYECTDNAAWYNAGYNSALAFEGLMENAFPNNDKTNTDGSPLDTLEFVDMNHVAAFAKNTIGFVVELSLAGTAVQPSTTGKPQTTTSAAKSTSVRPSTTFAPKCNHSECTAGPLLNKGCSACATAVCKQDSYCCSNQWDDQCVGQVNQYCTTVSC
ncbi:hypothetical protein BC830DRAFT_1062889 [Chytriomyces sp. MP71]|nr:hypothetical protein BC830DRAFT_1062889 [Chytriomyces sp. MP71]